MSRALRPCRRSAELGVQHFLQPELASEARRGPF